MVKRIHFVLMLIVFVACSGGRKEESVAYLESTGDVSAVFSPSTPAFDSYGNETESVEAAMERKLIKNGSITFEATNVKKTKTDIEALCKEFNAYISGESQNNYGNRLQFNQNLRVPASRFDSLIQRIEALAERVEDKSVHTEDVTEEFIDVEARLTTKKELEARYRELLKQAKTVTDLVAIEGQIANVRSEIESMEGRLKYLRNQVAFSTLSVTYYEPIGADFGFANKFVHALGDGWDDLLEFLLSMVNLWPFLLILAGLIYGFRAWRKRKQSQSAA